MTLICSVDLNSYDLGYFRSFLEELRGVSSRSCVVSTRIQRGDGDWDGLSPCLLFCHRLDFHFRNEKLHTPHLRCKKISCGGCIQKDANKGMERLFLQKSIAQKKASGAPWMVVLKRNWFVFLWNNF